MTDNWILIRTVTIAKKATRSDAGFTGIANVYEYVGPDPTEKIKRPRYGAVVQLTSKTDGYHCAGHITDAIKKVERNVAGCRANSAAHERVDWGAPIGKPSLGPYIFV